MRNKSRRGYSASQSRRLSTAKISNRSRTKGTRSRTTGTRSSGTDRRQNNPADPPRVQLLVYLPVALAHGIIEIAASEHWSVSRVITEALTDYSQGRTI